MRAVNLMTLLRHVGWMEKFTTHPSVFTWTAEENRCNLHERGMSYCESCASCN